MCAGNDNESQYSNNEICDEDKNYGKKSGLCFYFYKLGLVLHSDR